MLNDPSELSLFLAAELKRRKLTKRAAGREMKLSHTALGDIISGAAQPTIETVKVLAKWLGIPRLRVMKMAGWVPASEMQQLAFDALEDKSTDEIASLLADWQERLEERRRLEGSEPGEGKSDQGS